MTDYQAGPEGGEYLYPGSGDPAPRVGAKVQLLTIGGAHTNGPWRDDGSCLGWLPLPKRNMEKEDMTDKITIERETAEQAANALLDLPLRTDREVIAEALRAALAALAAQPVTGCNGLHPATANLVMRFAEALASKLADAEKKYGYSDGWLDSDWMDECRAKLVEHVRKGDPRDVAAYCAFLWHHGESTAPPAPAAVPPDERIEKALRRAFDLGQKYWQQIDMLKAHGRDVASIEANFERHVESFFEHGTSPDMAVSGYGWEPT